MTALNQPISHFSCDKPSLDDPLSVSGFG